MEEVASSLAREGWTLRTGGAHGADQAFEAGARAAGGAMELFLPWQGFEGRESAFSCPRAGAVRIAAKHHPSWASLKDGAKLMHARNVHQVLGWDCLTPSRFVICWTPDGSVGRTSSRTGGTGQAIRVAFAHRVRIVNMALSDWEESLAQVLVEATLLE